MQNPLERYKHTRHNVGGSFIEWLAGQYNLELKDAEFGRYFETKDALYIQSKTYMNLSGNNLKYLERHYHIENLSENFMVLVDDLETKVGKTKIKLEGSAK